MSGVAVSRSSRDERIFQPLGMTHTSWRDDYTRIVKDRAIAYSRDATGYHTDMPFENVYGNGGLLTTVGDLLQVERALRARPRSGMQRFVAEQQKPGHFNDGRPHDYAPGSTSDRTEASPSQP